MNYYIIPDRDGKTNIAEFVKETGPLVKIVKLPPHASDINDWQRQGGTQSQFERAAKRAKTYFEIKVNEIPLLDDGQEKDSAMRESFELLFEIKDPFAQSRMEEKMIVILGIGKRQFNQFKKALQSGTGKKITEPDIRDIWIERHPDTLWGLGFWRRYENGYWPVIQDDVIEREIMDILAEFERQGGPACSDTKVKSVAALARRKLYAPASQWDAQDDNVLVCANGVLNLETMQVEDHCREHYATAGLDYDYDPSADCPNFMYLLNSTVPESRGFVQEFSGYALTTRTEHEIAIWFYGQPGSGKSTIIEGVKSMLGSKAGLLSLARLESNPRFAMVNLPGKTLVFATEAPGDYIKSAEILSAIISGEEVKLERKHKDEVDFCPRAKILWAMNTLPRTRAGQGIFRRIKVVQFPPFMGKKDVALKHKIKAERAGILNWAIEGLKRLDTRGYFEIPFSVEVSTNMWSTISDKPLLFTSEWCDVYDVTGDPADFFNNNRHKAETAETLYDAYKEWCLKRSYRHESEHRINNEWRRLGLVPYFDGRSAWWLGISLKGLAERGIFGFK